MAKVRSLSPRLASSVADNVELQDALLMNDIFTSQELAQAGVDAEEVASRLGLSLPAGESFAETFASVREKALGSSQARAQQLLDVLDDEGRIFGRRPRMEVHRQGLWHRALNVWVLCPDSARVLMGQRAVSKDADPDKWSCVSCRVPCGESSMDAAVDRLKEELGITARPDMELHHAFTMKSVRDMKRGCFSGLTDRAIIDVFVACLDEELPLELVHLDVRCKRAAKYVEVEELQQALAEKDGGFVIPATEEYSRSLIRFIKRMCAEASRKPE